MPGNYLRTMLLLSEAVYGFRTISSFPGSMRTLRVSVCDCEKRGVIANAMRIMANRTFNSFFILRALGFYTK